MAVLDDCRDPAAAATRFVRGPRRRLSSRPEEGRLRAGRHAGRRRVAAFASVASRRILKEEAASCFCRVFRFFFFVVVVCCRILSACCLLLFCVCVSPHHPI